MGVSTDGVISYGIPFEEGFKFPWDDPAFDSDIEKWWKDVQGYAPLHDDLWDENGDYGEGYTGEKLEEEQDHERAFMKTHPLPIAIENYCSYDCPMYMITLSRGLTNRRGYPEEIDVGMFDVGSEERKSLIDFCEEYIKPCEGYEMPELDPKWYLSSYWG
jgi:hypothetical protein